MRAFLLTGLIASSVLAVVSPTSRADERNFLVLPVTTELQRSAIGSRSGVRAYVVINAKALVGDGDTVRWKDLDFDTLRKALTPFCKETDAAVIFHLFLDGSIHSDSERLLRWALVGFGRDEARFRDARVVTTHAGGFDWERHLSQVNERVKANSDGKEPASRAAGVTVYPVRAILSCHLFSNADCVVTIEAPFGERSEGRLSPEVDRAVRQLVTKLKLTEKERILFRVRHKKGCEKAAESFYETTARELAEALGFKHRSMENSCAP